MSWQQSSNAHSSVEVAIQLLRQQHRFVIVHHARHRQFGLP
jgi:hypothetical protein